MAKKKGINIGLILLAALAILAFRRPPEENDRPKLTDVKLSYYPDNKVRQGESVNINVKDRYHGPPLDTLSLSATLGTMKNGQFIVTSHTPFPTGATLVDNVKNGDKIEFNLMSPQMVIPVDFPLGKYVVRLEAFRYMPPDWDLFHTGYYMRDADNGGMLEVIPQ